ncbi:MAG: Rpp14/Pop5 family protein [Halobacteriales archaeon]
MSTLPKHLRERWRYLAVGIETGPDADLSRGRFQRHLWYAAQNLVGDVGSADADLQVLGFSFADGEGEAVVRARHGQVEQARAVLACLDEVGGDPVGVRVRGVSGTVRACEEKYLGSPTIETEERTVAFRGAERPAVARGERVDVRTGSGIAGATHLNFE